MSKDQDKIRQNIYNTVREKIYRIHQAANTINGLIELNLQTVDPSSKIAPDLATIQSSTNEITIELHNLLTLFVPEVSTAEPANTPTPNQDVKQRKILVVDDNATNRRILKHIVQKQGHIVEEAVNGREACEIVENKEIDIVFMDISMPVMDGIEATHHIRNNLSAPRNKVPIYAVTAHSFQEDKDRCLNAEMNGVIVKPVRSTDILEAIKNALILSDALAQPYGQCIARGES